MENMTTKQLTDTSITSVTPSPELELCKAYLNYRDTRKDRKKQKYKIKIMLEAVSSNSEEFSAEEDLISEGETVDAESPKLSLNTFEH